MEFLKAKLSENQVIIASSYSEDELFTSFDKVITLRGKAIEKRQKKRKTIRAIIYVRYFSDNQREESIEDQGLYMK